MSKMTIDDYKRIISNARQQLTYCEKRIAELEELVSENESGNKKESNWYKLFGTPERTARTLEHGKTLCALCDKQICSTNGGECRILNYDALLEWLSGGAE